MSSRARPAKHDKLPPPLYLTSTGIIYCRTCGRVITPRRSHNAAALSTPVKFCSDRCRKNKPGPVDRHIEEVMVAMLDGNKRLYTKTNEWTNDSGIDRKTKQLRKQDRMKNSTKVIVWCSEVQAIVFGHEIDQEIQNAEKMDDSTVNITDTERRSKTDGINYESEHIKLQESPGRDEKCINGQQKAEEREKVRRAARRGVVFGFKIKDANVQKQPEDTRVTKLKEFKKKSLIHSGEEVSKEPSDAVRLCEAVMTPAAIVVEPSFAKGDWGIRWRS